MPDYTTIQLTRETAEMLKQRGGTYEEAILKSLLQKLTYTFSFKQSIPALKSGYQEEMIPYTGKLRELILHFPPGPQGLVDVRLLRLGGNSIVQTVPGKDQSYISLDEANPHITLDLDVIRGEKLRVEWFNYDGMNSHTVPVIATMEY